MITDLVATLCFTGFVLGGLALLLSARKPAPANRRQLATSLFLFYVLGVSLGAGFGQRDLWPFAAWNLVAGHVPRTWVTIQLVGVDTSGREHPIDARAWEPLSIDELRAWLLQDFEGLDSTSRDRVMQDLLARANAARIRAITGLAVGVNARYLGPFTAPLFMLHPSWWSAPREVPPEPFIKLRYYLESWDIERRLGGDDGVTRRLIHESPPSGSR